MKNLIRKTMTLLLPTELFDFAIFELRSRLGRWFAHDLPLPKNSTNYINLGCGEQVHDHFINVDFFSAKNIDYGMDLRYPFRIPSDSIDGVFTEHTLEHLTHSEVDFVLSECNRILKKGAKIRVVVPDLSIFIKHYYEKNDDWFDKWKNLALHNPSRHHMKNKFTKMFAINFTASFYHHKTCWDLETIKTYLIANNFTNVIQYDFKVGTPVLLIDKDNETRKLVSLYIEATKV